MPALALVVFAGADAGLGVSIRTLRYLSELGRRVAGQGSRSRDLLGPDQEKKCRQGLVGLG